MLPSSLGFSDICHSAVCLSYLCSYVAAGQLFSFFVRYCTLKRVSLPTDHVGDILSPALITICVPGTPSDVSTKQNLPSDVSSTSRNTPE